MKEPCGVDSVETIPEGDECGALGQNHQETIKALEKVGIAVGFK